MSGFLNYAGKTKDTPSLESFVLYISCVNIAGRYIVTDTRIRNTGVRRRMYVDYNVMLTWSLRSLAVCRASCVCWVLDIVGEL